MPLLLLLTAASIAMAQVGNARQIADAVDRHYNDLQSLQTQFTESYRGAGMQRQESGTLWLKKPGKMRWEYASPREKLFISDGEKSHGSHVPGEVEESAEGSGGVKSMTCVRLSDSSSEKPSWIKSSMDSASPLT